MISALKTIQLLSLSDPKPFEVLNPDGNAQVLLICEHAGQAVPNALGNLGVDPEVINSHCGWDIGAGAVTRLVSEALQTPAVLQPYSRLVIDCNRPVEASDSVPEFCDGIFIPTNTDTPHRGGRIKEIFEPFQAEISHHLDTGTFLFALAIHSFTPIMNGEQRPWDIGLLFRHDTSTSERLKVHLEIQDPCLNVVMNQPYQISDTSDWFVPHHGEARGLPHCLIEIRNDQIDTPDGQKRFANILAIAIQGLLIEERTRHGTDT